MTRTGFVMNPYQSGYISRMSGYGVDEIPRKPSPLVFSPPLFSLGPGTQVHLPSVTPSWSWSWSCHRGGSVAHILVGGWDQQSSNFSDNKWSVFLRQEWRDRCCHIIFFVGDGETPLCIGQRMSCPGLLRRSENWRLLHTTLSCFSSARLHVSGKMTYTYRKSL